MITYIQIDNKIKITRQMFFCNNPCTNPDEGQILIMNNNDRSSLQSHINMNRENQQLPYIMVKPSKYGEYLAKCRQNNQSFTDKQFPPNQHSLNYKVQGRQIVWRRIPQLVKNCLMVENNITPQDIQQGNIGDCYFLAAISALAENRNKILNIFHNNMDLNGYGIYKIIVNYQGCPHQMVIDDYVPVYAQSNRPVFCKPNGREIWVMLLEKAWAKIRGSYGYISEGYPHEVLNTFSVAPCFYTQIHPHLKSQQKERIWKNLIQANDNVFAVCAGSSSNIKIAGIKQNHTYTVLGSFNVISGGLYEKIIKLRNPWGNTQYTGHASENDEKFWSKVDPLVKNKIFKAVGTDDGQFSIPFEQFLNNFNSIDISQGREGFNYDYWRFQITQHKAKYFRLTIEQEGQAYITVEKAFAEKPQNGINNNFLNYGYTRFVIARQRENTYEYFGSKLETNFPDLTIRSKFPKGIYIIMVQSSFPFQSNSFSMTCSLYSSIRNRQSKKLQELSSRIPNFLQHVFENHAHRYNYSKSQIGPLSGDWIFPNLLYEQGGYGYIACNLDEKTSIRLLITLDKKKIIESGYILEQGTPSQIIMQKGNKQTFIFTIDLKKKDLEQQLEFPPPGFKLSRLL